MLHKTRGIVLKTTNYAENSVVVQFFTEKFGLESYLIKGSRKANARIHKSLLQPLHLFDMVVYHKQGGNLQRIIELSNTPIFLSIAQDVHKSTIVLFLNEVLYKSLRRQSFDIHLFEFIFCALQSLDQQEISDSNFHLIFLIKLTWYLGFRPSLPIAKQVLYFDLKHGLFVPSIPNHPWYLSPPYTEYFRTLLQHSWNTGSLLKLSSNDRNHLVNKLLTYYSLHIEGFGTIRSHEVLRTILT